MKMKFALSVGLCILAASMLHALEFYDVSQPDIAKIKLNISSISDSSKNSVLIKKMQRQLTHSLLFENASAGDAEYLLEIENTIESGSIISTLKSSAESGFEPLVFGVKFKKQDETYISRKSAQVSNLMLKQLFGIKGSLGSPIIYSANDKSETQVKTLFLKYHGDDGLKQLTFNLFSNYGASWDPNGKTILYTAITARGTRVFMQGFRPLRVKSVEVFFDEGTGSAAEWGSTGRVFISKYVNRSNTDIYEYYLDGEKIYGMPTPKLRESDRITKNSAIETEPALSPDGRYLALISDRTGSPQVYVRDMQRKKMNRITETGKYNVSPSWSPDGKFIAYASKREGVSSIYRIDPKSKEENRVTPKSMNAESPTWSPDGSMIAFSGKKGGDWKIYYSLSSGGEAVRLTNSKSGLQETMPSWGPALR
ncbi:MAG: DPP IV N-terminal domain-containing protein [SAR324 cluster bacterium]|jgi:TolB protein|nr:DPP IV N-terminal domain-containing protein [SAR324 cluster bacterium]MDP7138954.1 DPP IV N-terminal domain-containing protein [SAR324 cluster bacterium]MDP7334708.1 DPP IV N-terminal domain-containing protein [SAR324 cluster bacterium]|tara:strand:+ start:1713 stop:2984 length:1272 start_codon:yes stop_codon:yes gene_type:complete